MLFVRRGCNKAIYSILIYWYCNNNNSDCINLWDIYLGSFIYIIKCLLCMIMFQYPLHLWVRPANTQLILHLLLQQQMLPQSLLNLKFRRHSRCTVSSNNKWFIHSRIKIFRKDWQKLIVDCVECTFTKTAYSTRFQIIALLVYKSHGISLKLEEDIKRPLSFINLWQFARFALNSSMPLQMKLNWKIIDPRRNYHPQTTLRNKF